MIADPQVFEDEHLPHRLEHRDAELDHLSRALQPVLDGARAEDVLLSGPSGVGKTVLSRYALARLDERAPVASAHVRCLGSTAGGILRDVIDALPLQADVHRGTPVDELVATLQAGLDAPAVLVLDEADDVPETDLLDRLARVPDVSTVMICHEPEDWLARVGDHHRRPFEGEHHLPLTRYTSGELADILAERAARGLHPAAVERAQLEEIADRVAGVARRGIQTLRAAAAVAGERGHAEIQARDIADGYQRAREQIREANLNSLPIHHHVLYSLIRQEGPLTGTELHAFYDEMADSAYQGRAQTPVSRRWRRTILAKLVSYDLVDRVEQDGDVQYMPIDLSLRSPLNPLADVLPKEPT